MGVSRELQARSRSDSNVVQLIDVRRKEGDASSPNGSSVPLMRNILDIEMRGMGIPQGKQEELAERTNKLRSNMQIYLSRALRSYDRGATPAECERALFNDLVNSLYRDFGFTQTLEPVFLHESPQRRAFGIYSSAVFFASVLKDLGQDVSVLLRPQRNVLLAGQYNLIDIMGSPILSRHVLTKEHLYKYPRVLECGFDGLEGLAWHVKGIRLLALGRESEAIDAFLNAVSVITPERCHPAYAQPILYLTEIAERQGEMEKARQLFKGALYALSGKTV